MDTNLNMGKASIETNRELSAILSNFSDDYIEAVFQEAITYKFRPFNMGPPNYPYLFESQFQSILSHYQGRNPDPIHQRREETYLMIINLICNNYQLQRTADINYEHLWPLCYKMYEIFISNFTEILIGFFTNYIFSHQDMIIGSMTDEQRVIKSNYGKAIYTEQNKIIMYENMDYALEAVASMDINFEQLIHHITDQDIANMICMYIADTADIYRNHFASYIRNPLTKTDIITSIKISFMKATVDTSEGNWSPSTK